MIVMMKNNITPKEKAGLLASTADPMWVDEPSNVLLMFYEPRSAWPIYSDLLLYYVSLNLQIHSYQSNVEEEHLC